ncbi:unnamed protein product [Bursaphelenchus xylophilus]|uniref:(pine wood nematode) hypothetical protein n=1 Tax=Bursaphelenchus xylophilus TaxID=6326 RepID=A0A1I7S8Y4_BURXY|nr:unnamed protein product [Bursaphelenchus xylophilus]CAG9086009.1 unnamed protein product [Bursaphelenchus xylophilus]
MGLCKETRARKSKVYITIWVEEQQQTEGREGKKMDSPGYSYYYGTPAGSSGSSSPGQSSKRPQTIQKAIKKKKSSEKEKIRNEEIKKKLGEISNMMPLQNTEGLSRIRTLRLAIKYIHHLNGILNGEMVYCPMQGMYRPRNCNDFQQDVAEEMQRTNSYKERAEMEMQMGMGTTSLRAKNSSTSPEMH